MTKIVSLSLSFLMAATLAVREAAAAADRIDGGESWCEPAPELGKALEAAYGKDDGTLTSTQLWEGRLGRMRALREAHPDDLFVHLQYQSAWRGAPNADRAALIAEYRARLASRPDDPVSRYLLAMTLIGRRTDEAATLLDQVVQQEPDLARAHLAFVKIAQTPSHRDKDKALAHLKS